MHAHTNSRLLFQKWSKSAHCAGYKKHILASLGETAGAIYANFLCECAPWPLTYILGFIQIRSGLGRYNQKAPPQARVNAIWALWAYNKKISSVTIYPYKGRQYKLTKTASV